jgi:hypothetical protein
MSSGQTIILATRRQREIARQLVDRAPMGAVVNIQAARRSNEQSAKMWAMISDISRAKPEGRTHSPDVWKSLFMSACGHAVQFENGLNGQPFPVGFRSSRLTKEQMGDLIECITEYGARHGVAWSKGDE